MTSSTDGAGGPIVSGSRPRLATFIRSNVEPILAEWESFARGMPGGGAMNIAALRDHAREMLQVIVVDLEEPQTAKEQSDKAQGLSDAAGPRESTPAQAHGAGRAESGFDISQMVAEFRALRASVVQLWMAGRPDATSTDIEDLIRFNEAIDQAIAESITTYARDVKEAKDRFLAILGHDLRTPLGAIITSTAFMRDYGALAEPHGSLIVRIEQSAWRMNQMVTDLLDFTRTRFGDRIPIDPIDMDLAEVIRDVASEARASRAGTDLRTSCGGDLRGRWDRARLTQALVNLVSNAVEHGDANQPISIAAERVGDAVVVRIHNFGAPIPDTELPGLFQPMKDAGRSGHGDRRHLGLGLYIVDRIIKGHGGRVEVQSDASAGTTFAVHLPMSSVESPAPR